MLRTAIAAAQDEEPAPHGPVEAREEWLLAQPRLTLASISPDCLPAGRTELRVHLDWGNDFGWDQDAPGESPRDRRFLVDGEHRTLALQVRRAVRPGLDLSARLPLEWRGGGVLDGTIDWFHDFTGFPGNSRDSFRRDEFRVTGRDDRGRRIRWNGQGTGIGRLELQARRLTFGSGEVSRPRASVVASMGLPTGTGPFAAPGLGLGAQLVAALPIARSWTAYGGGGATFETERRIEGVEYERARAHGFLAIEWRPGRRWGLLAETSAASRLVTNLARYPALEWYLRLSARLNLALGWSLEGGFAEGLSNQQATTDFGIQVGLVRSLGRRP